MEALTTARAREFWIVDIIEVCLTENLEDCNIVSYKFGVDRGGDGRPTGYFGIKIGTDTSKFTNVRIAGFGFVAV